MSQWYLWIFWTERGGWGWERMHSRGVLLEYTLICGTWWEIHGYTGAGVWGWGGGAMWSGGSLLLGIQGCEGGIHLLLWLQWMPLGDGTTGVGQHVGPVFQPGPRGLASHPDLSNGIVLANLVIIQHCDHSLDFLGETGEKHHNKVQTVTVTE